MLKEQRLAKSAKTQLPADATGGRVAVNIVSEFECPGETIPVAQSPCFLQIISRLFWPLLWPSSDSYRGRGGMGAAEAAERELKL